MTKLFVKKRISFIKNKIDWKQAVALGVNLLVKDKKATIGLQKAIYDVTKQYGAYYVLEKGLALLHAKPGDYSLKPAVSVLFLKENIEFNNQNKWAKVIFTLSSPDEINHIGLIEEFGKFFMNEIIKQKILNEVENIKDLEKIIKSMEGGEKWE